jgi:hypothetical protein
MFSRYHGNRLRENWEERSHEQQENNFTQQCRGLSKRPPRTKIANFGRRYPENIHQTKQSVLILSFGLRFFHLEIIMNNL